jgi:hypothetical protein
MGALGGWVLSEVRRERGEHDASNVLPDTVEYVEHIRALIDRRSLTERYMAGEVELHAFFQWRRRGVTQQYCAIFYRAVHAGDFEAFDDVGDADRQHADTLCLSEGARNSQFAVLIDTVQLVDDPQRVPSEAAATLVRLKVCDGSTGRWIDPTEVIPMSALESCGAGARSATPVDIAKDRERRLFGPLQRKFRTLIRRGIMLEGKRVHEMIEGGPKVMNNVPNQEGDLTRQWLLEPNACDAAVALGIRLIEDGVRVASEPNSNYPLKSLKVVARPAELWKATPQHG